MSDIKASGRLVPASAGVGGCEVSGGPARAVPHTWTIRATAPCPWITANHRMNRWQLAAAVRDWRTAGYYGACTTRPRPPTGLRLARVDILLRWAKSPVREIENVRPTVKAVIDGALGPRRGSALGYGVVVDDSDRHLIYGTYASEVIAVRPSVLTLTPYFGQIVLTVTDISPTRRETPA